MRKLFLALLLCLLPSISHAYSPPVNCSNDGGHAEVYQLATNVWQCVAVSGGGGSGTVASSTIGQIPVYTGATTVTGSANFTISTGALTLGVSGTAGSIKLGNATSGTITIQPVTGALGSAVLSLPAVTDTLVGKATTDTLTNKTLTSPIISTISNTGTLTLPTSSDTLVGRATTDTLTNKTFDTAGTGNSFSINGVAATANTGTGATVVRSVGPTFTGTIAGANETLTGTIGIGTSSSLIGQVNFSESSYTTNQVVIQDGTQVGLAPYPTGYAPALVVQISEATGSRPLWFGYQNAGAWASFIDAGACGAFAQMCFDIGTGTTALTALANNGTTLMVGGGTNDSTAVDGSFTNLIFGVSNAIMMGTATPRNSALADWNVITNFGKAVYGAPPVTITPSGANYTPDLTQGNSFTMTLVHASCPCTLINPSGTLRPGQNFVLQIVQSATGGDQITTWGSNYLAPSGTASITLSSSAGAIDVFTATVISSSQIILIPAGLNVSH